MLDSNSTRNTGLFLKQQQKLKDQILERRRKGESVSTVWARARMKIICNQDKPSGYDRNKNVFGTKRYTNFLTRHGLSIRHKTNKKTFCFSEITFN